MDIKKAIEIEEYYLECRKKGEYPFHLVDKIKECGFESLSQFHGEKREYEFKRMKFTVTEVTQDEIVPEVHRILKNKLYGIWYADSDRTCVFNGDYGEKTFNKEYCVNKNIPIYDYLTSGGTIIHKKGDFSFGISCPLKMQIDSDFVLNRLKNILQKYTDKTLTVSGNDILVNGEKICGSAIYQKNGVFLFLSYFSFSDHSNLIEHICPVPKSGKTPSYIDFITREQFKSEVTAWLMV